MQDRDRNIVLPPNQEEPYVEEIPDADYEHAFG
jgi:hypothetical protein